MKTEKTEMIMKYFDVTYKVAKQYEIILKDKQIRQIKAWYETKKSDGTISAESEEVLKEILNKGKKLKSWIVFYSFTTLRLRCTISQF